MIKVLIVSNKNDFHAQMVTEGLKYKGALPIVYHTDENLFKQRFAHTISNQIDTPILLKNENNQEFFLDEVDVVWFRRASRHITLPKGLDPKDKKFIGDENYVHQISLWLTLSPSARWINPLTSREKANAKRLQLLVAKNVGLNIPATLISNDKTAIAEFIKKNKPIETIYKTFTPISWEENKDIYSCYATQVTENLPTDYIIGLTPGIYQERVSKQYEVRITFFGNEYVAVKIHNNLAQDWRSLIGTPDFKITPIQISEEIELKCQKLMKELGIVFGCFDFIITPDNKHVFLEVNEMGQFLWIEKLCPDLKLLDKFCNFIISEHPHKMNNKTLPSFGLKEIEDSVSQQSLTK